MPKEKDYIQAIKHEIEMWEEGLIREDEALMAIEILVAERQKFQYDREVRRAVGEWIK